MTMCARSAAAISTAPITATTARSVAIAGAKEMRRPMMMLTDGQREIDTELRAEAASEQAAWCIQCPECDQWLVGDYGDLDGHLTQEHGSNAEDWETFWLNMAKA
jgi:hypothetical protein